MQDGIDTVVLAPIQQMQKCLRFHICNHTVILMQKRSLKIAGHATSVALEPEFWQALEDIARRQKISLSALIATIDRQKEVASGCNLASQLRVFVLNECQKL